MVESCWIPMNMCVHRSCLPLPLSVSYRIRAILCKTKYVRTDIQSHTMYYDVGMCFGDFFGRLHQRKTSLDMICMVHPTNIQKTVTVTFAVIGHLFEGYRAIHFPNGLMGCISQAESPAVLYCGLGGYLAWGRSLWWPMGFGAAKIRV